MSRIVSGFVVVLLMVTSCKDANDLLDQTKVFKYNQPNVVTSLDPAFAKSQNNMWVMNHVYNTLVSLNDSLEVVPSLAKSWNIDSEGKTYTFHLRDDVYFQRDSCFQNSERTRKMVAADVAYSLTRLIDNQLNSPGSWLFIDKVSGPEAFKVIDDTTFVLQLNQPFIPTLGMLTMQYCSIVPKEAVAYYGDDFRSHPVGTGPYGFKRWIENQSLFLERNPLYFDTLKRPSHSPDYIKTSFIPDKQIAALELMNGKLDFMSGIESSFVNEFLDAEGHLKADKKEKITFIRTPYLNTEYIGINQNLAQEHPALRMKAFRQALNYALDRELMLSSLRNNVGLPANAGFVPRGLPSFNDQNVKGYRFDLKLAKKLIEESEVDVRNMSPLVLNTNAEYLDLVTFVAKQWEAIGVKTKIELLDTGILREGMRNSKLQMFRASWIADYPDAESYLTVFYSKNPAPPNYTRFSNRVFDRLYEQAIREPDVDKRYQLYQQMDKIIVDEAPVIFLFYDESSVFISNSLKGYTNNGLNMLNVNTLYKVGKSNN
ncbi:MAG TPA: ABC transporter substrate-binding protein [Saprospiraceae bacterium]|nr:ABC transporter substrate-binding protein [Saprospiraceae bacterium]